MLLLAWVTLRRRAVACPIVGLPTSSWAALPGRSHPFVIVGLRSSALGCPHCCGLPYLSSHLPSVSCGVEARQRAAHVDVDSHTAAVASSLSCGVEARRWAALPRCSPPFLVIGSRTSALGRPLCCGLPNLGVRLLSLLWGCVLRRWAAHLVVGCPTGHSPPFVVVRCRTSVLNCWHRCGQLQCDGRLLSSSCGVEPRRWATHAIVGSSRAEFASPRARVMSNVGIGQPTSV